MILSAFHVKFDDYKNGIPPKKPVDRERVTNKNRKWPNNIFQELSFLVTLILWATKQHICSFIRIFFLCGHPNSRGDQTKYLPWGVQNKYLAVCPRGRRMRAES